MNKPIDLSPVLIDRLYKKFNNMPLLLQFIQNCNCILGGSTVHEIIYNEVYPGNDIDIFVPYGCVEYAAYLYESFINTPIYKKHDKLYNTINVCSLYETFYKNKKIQLVELNCSFKDLIERYNTFIDLTICSSRIFFNKTDNKFKLAGSTEKTGHINNEHIANLLKQQGCFKIKRLNDRINKYYERGFTIETNNDFKCNICNEPLISHDIDILYNTKCNHVFHFSCILRWTYYEPGDVIQKAKSKCPLCRDDLCKNIELDAIDYDNFENTNDNTYVFCLICYNIFNYETSRRCDDVSEHIRTICPSCIELNNMDPYKYLKGQFINCPNCNLELQHGGGCAQFTCCRYGNDRCKRDRCDHGSTNIVQFCGFSWHIS